MSNTRIPNPPIDSQIDRCGHNFFVMECPYEFCGYRDTVIGLQNLLKAMSGAAIAENRLKVAA